MPSYLVTGVSRGIGYEFLRQISAKTDNVVVGLVRDKASTEKKVAADSELKSRSNIHIVHGDLSDYDSLKKSVEEVTPIVDGKLDYIIANAALMSQYAVFQTISESASLDPQKFEEDMIANFRTNVIGNIHLFTLYLPLVLAGSVKKVIAISSGMADLDLVRRYRLGLSAPYSISKAALNAAAVKFHVEYVDRGVLFLNVCPGLVDTGGFANATPEQQQIAEKQFASFQEYAPDLKGPSPPEESVAKILPTIEKASLEEGYGGEFISHKGKGEKWL